MFQPDANSPTISQRVAVGPALGSTAPQDQGRGGQAAPITKGDTFLRGKATFTEGQGVCGGSPSVPRCPSLGL